MAQHNASDRKLQPDSSPPHEFRSHRLETPSVSRHSSVVTERHPALEPENLDPSTKFLYTPHTITGLLIGEQPAARCSWWWDDETSNRAGLITLQLPVGRVSQSTFVDVYRSLRTFETDVVEVKCGSCMTHSSMQVDMYNMFT